MPKMGVQILCLVSEWLYVQKKDNERETSQNLFIVMASYHCNLNTIPLDTPELFLVEKVPKLERVHCGGQAVAHS